VVLDSTRAFVLSAEGTAVRFPLAGLEHTMNRRRWILLPAVLLLASCEEDSPSSGNHDVITETRSIRDVDYIKDRFFWIDPPSTAVGAVEARFEVYLRVLPQDLIADPTIVRIPCWAIPDSTSDGQPLWDAAAEIIADGAPDAGVQHDFRLLEPDVDYSLIFDGSTVVGFELAAPAPTLELRALAVQYLNPSGVPIGGTYAYYGINASEDTLLLEMIRPPDPEPTGPFASTWTLAMRNAYALGWQDIDPASLTVVIDDNLGPRVDTSRPEGSSVPYLRIFGLDQTDASGNGPPDGRIDPDRFDPRRGIVWFPDERAFAPDSVRVADWTDDGFQFTGPYQAQYDRARRIYEERLNATQADDVSQYLITATATVPAP
jgi:hypothetical protein